MIVLGIESSCDETAAAVLSIKMDKLTILSNIVNSQVKIHKNYGGVVPEVAARQHMQNILPIIELALENASLELKDIDLIAVTLGPGLATSLMVGLETAKTLAWINNKNFISVNHLVGHIWSWLLPVKERAEKNLTEVNFPFITLLVSGGHTELILVKDFNKFELLGRTLDDAVGEAFDKVAKMLGLGYPGGPEIAREAVKGNRDAFSLPRPMLDSDDLNFSFAGLKTAVLYELKKQKISKKLIKDMAASFEKAAVDVLLRKTLKAVSNSNVKNVVVAGGVSANQYLRQEFAGVKDLNIKFPEVIYTGDNAAMIALAGYFLYNLKPGGSNNDYLGLKALPNLIIV